MGAEAEEAAYFLAIVSVEALEHRLAMEAAMCFDMIPLCSRPRWLLGIIFIDC